MWTQVSAQRAPRRDYLCSLSSRTAAHSLGPEWTQMRSSVLGHCGGRGRKRTHSRQRQACAQPGEEGGTACCRVLGGLGQLEPSVGARDWLGMRWGGLVCPRRPKKAPSGACMEDGVNAGCESPPGSSVPHSTVCLSHHGLLNSFRTEL